MAKGKILQHLGNSKYQVEMEYDYSYVDNQIRKLEGELALPEFLEAIEKAETAVTDATAESDAAKVALDAAIASGIQEDVKKATKAHLEKLLVTRAAEQKVGFLKQQRAAKQLELQRLKDLPRTSKIVEAWSVDPADGQINEDAFPDKFPLLAGEVDVFIDQRDQEQTFHIPSKMLGHDGGGGILQQPMATASAAVAWNYAMQPGFQRWLPIIRLGLIVGAPVGATEFDVDLFPDRSADNLPLHGIYKRHKFGVEYYCGAGAFQYGDSVVVRIDGWQNESTPIGVIIGFASNPRKCQGAQSDFSSYGTFINGFGKQFIWGTFSSTFRSVEILEYKRNTATNEVVSITFGASSTSQHSRVLVPILSYEYRIQEHFGVGTVTDFDIVELTGSAKQNPSNHPINQLRTGELLSAKWPDLIPGFWDIYGAYQEADGPFWEYKPTSSAAEDQYFVVNEVVDGKILTAPGSMFGQSEFGNGGTLQSVSAPYVQVINGIIDSNETDPETNIQHVIGSPIATIHAVDTIVEVTGHHPGAGGGNLPFSITIKRDWIVPEGAQPVEEMITIGPKSASGGLEILGAQDTNLIATKWIKGELSEVGTISCKPWELVGGLTTYDLEQIRILANGREVTTA